MRGERQLLRLGEYLVDRACQQLPQELRAERYREWAAELPAILHDPQVRPALRRVVRMLGYAADTLRGTIMTPTRARGHIPRLFAAVDRRIPVIGLVVVALNVWGVVQAPGNEVNYLQLAWALLFAAYLLRKRVRPAGRVTGLLGISAILALGGVYLWSAAQAPGDWVNYLMAALLLLTLLVARALQWWLHRARSPRTSCRTSDP